MAEETVTVSTLTTTLANFHREVILPDIERVVGESEARINKRFDDVDAHFDEIYKRFDRLGVGELEARR